MVFALYGVFVCLDNIKSFFFSLKVFMADMQNRFANAKSQAADGQLYFYQMAVHKSHP